MKKRDLSLYQPVLVLGLSVLPAIASAQEQDNTPQELSTITVNVSADASKQGLLPEFAGDQVATGGRVGILGAIDNMESPFSLTSYTSQYIQQLQAPTVASVVQHDPAVRTARGFGNFQESYFMRGFLTASDDIAYNGLYGLLPRQATAAELAERVEVLRGAGGFLYGAAPSGGGIGGTINILPKRAADTPLSRVGLSYGSGDQRSIKADISRRFADDAAGVRVNAVKREGGTAVQKEHTDLDLYTIGLDWRGEQTRVSLDLGYQNHKLKQIRPSVTLGSGQLPLHMPDNKVNFTQPWTFSNERTVFGTVRAEYDLSQTSTAWLALGGKRGKEENSLAGLRLADAYTGDSTFYRFDNARRDHVNTGEVGMRTSLDTAGIAHELVVAATYYDHKEFNAWAMGGTLPSNLYQAIHHAPPPTLFGGGNLQSPGLVGRNRLSSYTLGDLMYFWDDRIELLLGLRHQLMDTRSYVYGSGALDRRDKQSHTSPAAGLLFRLNDELAIYTNYIESLAQGDLSPTVHNGQPVLNAGQRLSPFVAKQKEVGIKFDNGTLGASLAAFSTSKPRSIVNAQQWFEQSGKDRHQGLELSFFGQLNSSVKVLGGITTLHAKQKNTHNVATEGKQVIGVPRWQANLGLTWDIPQIEGLSLDTQVIATGARYADAENQIRVPGWARWDIGASYQTKLADTPVTLRATVENVANKSYWASVGGYPNNGYLVVSQPRNLMFSVSAEF